MKKYIITIMLLLLNISYAQNKFSFGVSSGFTKINSTYAINQNLYIGYNTSKNITLGIDLFRNHAIEESTSIKTIIIMPYLEGGIPESGMIKDKFYFSGVVGSGLLSKVSSDDNKKTLAIFVGTKVNYKLLDNFLIGLKFCYYYSNLQGVTISNLFLTYKYK